LIQLKEAHIARFGQIFMQISTFYFHSLDFLLLFYQEKSKS
jgi:hypothetical protein